MKYSFEIYCKDYENIENYQKAKNENFKGWQCHHRLETHNSDGERRLVDITRDELLALGMYYGRPAEELIFLTKSEHSRLHHKGKLISEETRKKLSEANKGKHLGKDNPFYGKHHSEENRKKLSEANKGKHWSSEQKIKQSKAIKGRHWFNDGKINKLCYECPAGFVTGKLLIYRRNK